jgi:hypothetical protein
LKAFQSENGGGYPGSVVQLRRAVAGLRPQVREPFLRLHTLAGEHYGESGVMVTNAAAIGFWRRRGHTRASSWRYITRSQGFEPLDQA